MTITKRNTKGSALTYAEMDENIRDLFEDTTLERVIANGNTATSSASFADIRANHTSVVETGSGANPFTDIASLYGKRVIWNRTTDQEYVMPNPTAVDIGKSIIILNASTSTTAVLKFDFGSVTTTRFADVNGLTALTGDKEVSILAGGVVEVLVIGAGDIVLFGSNLTAL